MNTSWLSTKSALILALTAIATFHLTFLWEAAAGLFAIDLFCLYQLAWVKSTRWAFYRGFGVGYAIGAPQLCFLGMVQAHMSLASSLKEWWNRKCWSRCTMRSPSIRMLISPY